MLNIKRNILKRLKRIFGEEAYLKARNSFFYFLSYFKKDKGYSADFYLEQEKTNGPIYKLLADTFMQEFRPTVLVDVGCGCGGISKAFLDAGVSSIFAFDYSSASVKATLKKGLSKVKQLDLTKAKKIPAQGDLCICFEVVEHIPGKYAERVCELLSKVSPVLALTAAPPGQGGYLHVNEQPQSYWIELMRKYSMEYDAKAVESIRSKYKNKMIRDYDRNLMVFRRKKSK